MDLNGDGNIDILSGSYSHHEQPMAGLFQVLWGKPDGTWGAAAPLLGDNGEKLIVTPQRGDDADLDRICTRAFAVDLDDDGKLDLVTGNFGGTFAVFAGLGGGKFASKNTWLERDGKSLEVPHHSDPFFVDWDGDGDFDMLSGSSDGGVFLFVNEGSKKAARWGARQTLYEGQRSGMPVVGENGPEVQFGEAHVKAPAGSTRVWVADVDGDGKLDLLVGDQTTITKPAKGLTEAEARQQLAEWQKAMQKLFESEQKEGADQEAAGKAFQKHWEAKAKIVDEAATGFVWLLRQK